MAEEKKIGIGSVVHLNSHPNQWMTVECIETEGSEDYADCVWFNWQASNEIREGEFNVKTLTLVNTRTGSGYNS